MRIPIAARIFLAAIALGALAGFIVPTSSDKLSQVNSCLDIKVQVERRPYAGCSGNGRGYHLCVGHASRTHDRSGDWCGEMITNKEMVERLKAATVGSRGLDEDIAMCLLGAEFEIQHGKKQYYKGNYWISIEPVDCTTTSLDTAMAVIEDKLPRSAIRIHVSTDQAKWGYPGVRIVAL